jgi:hypothetical protein
MDGLESDCHEDHVDEQVEEHAYDERCDSEPAILDEFREAYAAYVGVLRKIMRGDIASVNSPRWCSISITHAETSGLFALNAITGVSPLGEQD